MTEEKKCTIALHHNNGTIVELSGISKTSLVYLRTYVGKDAIYQGAKLAINLREFCIVEAKPENKNPEEGEDK